MARALTITAEGFNETIPAPDNLTGEQEIHDWVFERINERGLIIAVMSDMAPDNETEQTGSFIGQLEGTVGLQNGTWELSEVDPATIVFTITATVDDAAHYLREVATQFEDDYFSGYVDENNHWESATR